MTQPPPHAAIDGVTVVPNFLSNHQGLYDWCVVNVPWDDRIQARKTASCGVPYNYAGLDYPRSPFPPLIEAVRSRIAAVIGFDANNCLMNWYPDGRSRMGFHADSAAGLAPNSGVAIVSLGAPRTLRFRRTATPDERLDYPLVPGELLFMEKRVQDEWQHAVPRNSKPEGRISLTFRVVEA
ncbi:MAG: alpha-ketoglutarate-dependent dioxygenase AlkB [Myxococcales bacterium]|nr:alpha-ketoglutarate-dependent dioxygenase AlkB [Myxococcales bacterium]